jgi:hypothetical protein
MNSSTAHDYSGKLERDASVNYVQRQMTFGDMNFDDVRHSISLFTREVMPAFA